ncbi:FAD-binding oxidoreductase [Nakamurella lactea]|uniref:FAD-binding oxidoreductase n=1 Tax=Nakamurella lactea TaxID=459515 RepID=UPI0004090B64|nr:FAD-binding oxidoreductase [Nakamurella lactea]
MNVDPLLPGDPGFDAAVAVLPATGSAPKAVPAAIFAASDEADVDAAVGYARALGRRLTVRSGGHSLSGTHLRGGAVALDLRRLTTLAVDRERGIARLGPGLTSAAAAAGLAAAGCSFPVGHSPLVGIGGFLLAGGNGWQIGTSGPGAGNVRPAPGCAADRVLAARVVTGDGSTRRVDARSDPDLWWALRGAGSAFPGVVTEFTVRVDTHSPVVGRRTWSVPAAAAAELGEALDALEPLPAGVELTVMARPAVRGAMITVVATTFAETERALVAVRSGSASLDRLAGEVVDSGPYASAAALLVAIPDHAANAQWSHHVWGTGSWRAVLDAVPMTQDRPSERSTVLIARAPSGAPEQPAALYRAPGTLGVSAYAHWDPESGTAGAAIGWTHQVLAGVGGSAPRRYIGEADITGDPARIRECFPPGAVERLIRLRSRVDPDRVVASVLDLLD